MRQVINIQIIFLLKYIKENLFKNKVTTKVINVVIKLINLLIYIIVVVIICIHSLQCVLYYVCSFVCCVAFDRGVILCDVCYLFVVFYCITTATG
jgi:hypothetical protein